MVKTKDSDPTQVPLNFSDPNVRRRNARYHDDDEGYDSSCSIWSARFSADGNEVWLRVNLLGNLAVDSFLKVIAGGNGKIFGEIFNGK